MALNADDFFNIDLGVDDSLLTGSDISGTVSTTSTSGGSFNWNAAIGDVSGAVGKIFGGTTNSNMASNFSWDQLWNAGVANLKTMFLNTETGKQLASTASQQAADAGILAVVKSPITWIVVGAGILLLVVLGRK